MKIKTITCHHVYNYGASLQAYALMKHLKNEGHEVEIIDYLPDYKLGRYKFIYVPYESKYHSIGQKHFLFRLLYSILHRRWWVFKAWGRKKSFDSFKRKYLCCTKKCYNSAEHLNANPPVADVYIAGSDQIWNTDMKNGLDKAYYADFGKQETRRIAYAASFGIENIKVEYCDFIAKEVAKFNAISVREKVGLSILKQLGIKEGVQVTDPVFLLNKKEWMQLGSYAKIYTFKQKNYILIYDFVEDERIRNFALQIKEKTGFPIVSINDCSSKKYADYNINDAGPLEFIDLIDKASYIISNSFHGTAFSIIFNKEFYTFSLNTQQTSSRMTDLLDTLGLSERFNAKSILRSKINYQLVNDAKEVMTGFSKKWLASTLIK